MSIKEDLQKEKDNLTVKVEQNKHKQAYLDNFNVAGGEYITILSLINKRTYEISGKPTSEGFKEIKNMSMDLTRVLGNLINLVEGSEKRITELKCRNKDEISSSVEVSNVQDLKIPNI